MALPAWIAAIFEPAVKLVDELHTSAEEKGQMKAALFGAQAGIVTNVLDYESKLAANKTSIILAEAQGESYLQKNWRPILMLVIVAIVANNHLLYPYLSLFFNAAPLLELPDKLWSLMQIGVGGYVVGRSGEKIVKTLNSN
jgi:hypothetical protein